ncbi:hypothetical protein [Nonomuraea sp. NPDC023979]|uniref:hypothetical protein n=1 Tax=Nonomuraea sp. NPDC023979 TaxID=3154796 RepID=UPI0034082B07
MLSLEMLLEVPKAGAGARRRLGGRNALELAAEILGVGLEVPYRRMVDSAAVTSRRAALIIGQNRRCPVAWL